MSLPSEFHMTEGMKRLRKARSFAFSASRALAAGDPTAEGFARSALDQFASAMNWMEGAAEFDLAHTELHEVGLMCYEHFGEGCRFAEVGPDFEQRCPAALVHSRFGFSPSMTGNAICSICDVDVSECPHRPGATYKVTAAVHASGRCNICAEQRCREHTPGEAYDAQVRITVTEVDHIEEISIVAKPRQPDARLRGVRIPRADFEAKLGHLIPVGAPLNCDRCAGECSGFSYLE